MKSVNEVLQDQAIHHGATDLMKLEAGSRKKVLKMLKKLEKDIIFQLIDNDPTAPMRTTYQTKRLQALLTQTKDTINTAYSKQAKAHTKDLYNLADVEGNIVEGKMNAALNANVSSVKISKNRLNAISKKTLVQGKYPNQWWAKQSQGLQDKFSNEMRMGMNQHESIGKLSNRLRKNVMPVSRRNAEALVRTSQAAVIEEAKQASYEEMSDLLKGYRYSATFDSRTTQYCKAADGTVFNKSYNVISGAGWAVTPPNHWNCRSTLIPITKSWEELESQYKDTDFFNKKLDKIPSKTRASMDGKVPKGITYNDWLKTKDIPFQNQVLGKTRAEYFRDGKIKHLAQLIDQSGKPLTIDHLKQKIVNGTLKDIITGKPMVSALSKAGKAARELIKKELAEKAELAAVVKNPGKTIKDPVVEPKVIVEPAKPDLLAQSLSNASTTEIDDAGLDLLDHFTDSSHPGYFRKRKFTLDGKKFDMQIDDHLDDLTETIQFKAVEAFQRARSGKIDSLNAMAGMQKQYLTVLTPEWQDTFDYIIKAHYREYLVVAQKENTKALNAFLKLVGDVDEKDSYYAKWVHLLKQREALYVAGKTTPKALTEMDDYIEQAWFRYIEQLDDKAYSKERDKLLKNMLGETKDYDKHFKKLKQGAEYIPYDILKALSDNKFKVNIIHKYGYRANYRSTGFAMDMGMNDRSIVFAHELGHAIDGLFNKNTLTGLKWKNNPWVTKKQGADLQKVYMNRTKGIKDYNNGDGKFFDDNWLDDYEGRIYSGDGDRVGNEWWSMNVQRYNDYLRRIAVYKKKVADDFIKFEKAWKYEPDKAYVKKAIAKRKITDKKEFKDLIKSAEIESEWFLAKKRYPELTSLIENVFDTKKRISQDIPQSITPKKKVVKLKVKKPPKIDTPAMQSAPDIEVFKKDTVLLNSKYKEVKTMPKLKKKIYEPEFEKTPGYNQSAGAIVFDENTGKVWLVEPTNHYGGYKHTFPKGTLEKGMSAQQSALKEVWEEAGLEIELLDVLGDYKKTTSVTRYYIGVVKKGDPTKFEWETQSVKLVSPKDAKKLLNTDVDKKIFKDFEKQWKEFEDMGMDSKDMKVAFKEVNLEKKADALEYQLAMEDMAADEAYALKTAKDGYTKLVLAGQEPTDIQKKAWLQATNDEKTALAIAKTKEQITITDAKDLYTVKMLEGKSPKLSHKKIWDTHATTQEKTALNKKLKKAQEVKDSNAKAVKFSKMIDEQMEEYKALIFKGDDVPDDIRLTWDLHADKATKKFYKEMKQTTVNSWKTKYENAMLKGTTPSTKTQEMWAKHATKAEQTKLSKTLAKQPAKEKIFNDAEIIQGKADYVDAIAANKMPKADAISIWSKYASTADEKILKKVMADNSLEEFDPTKILKTKEVPKKIKLKPSALYKDLVNHLEPNLGTVKLGTSSFDLANSTIDTNKFANNIKYYLTQYKKKMIEGKNLTKTEIQAMNFLSDESQDIFIKEIDDILIQIAKVTDADLPVIPKVVQPDIPTKTVKPVKPIKTDVDSEEFLKGFKTKQPSDFDLTGYDTDDIMFSDFKFNLSVPKDAKEFVELTHFYLNEAMTEVLKGVQVKDLVKDMKQALSFLKLDDLEMFMGLAKIKPSVVKKVLDSVTPDIPITPITLDNDQILKAVTKQYKMKPSKLYGKAFGDSLDIDPQMNPVFKIGTKTYDWSEGPEVKAAYLNHVKYNLTQYKKKMGSINDKLKPTKTDIQAYNLLTDDAKLIFDIEIDDMLKAQQSLFDDISKGTIDIPTIVKPIKPAVTIIEPTDIVKPAGTIIDKADYVKYKPAKGSNPGGFYESKSNPAERWYFKEVGEDKAYNEILAARLYEKAGVNVPDVQPMTYGKQTGVASRIVDGVEENSKKLMSGKYKVDIEENFMVDAWLANWDTVGTGYDNMVFVGNKVLRIDVGGSLRYRAMGSKKGNLWNNAVDEINSLRDSNTNVYAAEVFKNVTKKQMEIGARKVLSISDTDIRQLVNQFGKHLGKAEKKDLIDTLIARKKTIAKKFPKAVPTRVKPAKVIKGQNVNKQELQGIEDSRGNGLTIKTDKDQIEDGDLLIYPEKSDTGVILTSAMLKLTRKGQNVLNKQIDNLVKPGSTKPKIMDLAQQATSTKGELDVKISKALGGSFEQMRKGLKLRPKDIGRARDVDTLWMTTSNQIREGIRLKQIDKSVLVDFRAHYKIWMDRAMEIIDAGDGGVIKLKGLNTQKLHTKDVLQLIKPFEIKTIIKKTKKIAPLIDGKLKWEVKYGTFDRKTVTDNHLVRHNDQIPLIDGSSYSYRYYETILPDETIIRYWADPDSAKALKGRVEIISKGKIKEGTDNIFETIKKLGINADRMTPEYQEELYLIQLLYGRNQPSSFSEIMADLKKTKGAGKRIELLKNRYNGLVGRQVTDSPEYNPFGEQQAFGQGRRLTYRPDLETEKDWGSFKKEYVVHHQFHNNVVSDLKAIINGGGQLAPNTDKFRRGFTWGGMSPAMDVREGGGAYVYTRIKTKSSAYYRAGITWKVDILKRNDAISFHGDEMGRANPTTIKNQRRSTVGAFKQNSNSSGNETLFKNSLSVFDQIDRIIVSSITERNELIDYLKEVLKSDTMPDGRKITAVVKKTGSA